MTCPTKTCCETPIFSTSQTQATSLSSIRPGEERKVSHWSKILFHLIWSLKLKSKYLGSVWGDIHQQSDQLEKELLLAECISSFWQAKQKSLLDFEFDPEKIGELFRQVIKLLKEMRVKMHKVEEIFTLEIYKLWLEHYNKIIELFNQIHALSGRAMSYMMANKILDEVYFISEDDSRITEADKSEGRRLYGRSFDLLGLIGCFEKPIGTEAQIQKRLSRR